MLEERDLHKCHCKYYNYELGEYKYPPKNLKVEVEKLVSKGANEVDAMWLALNVPEPYKSMYMFIVYIMPNSPFLPIDCPIRGNPDPKDYRKRVAELIKDIKEN
jgi:hypothetical protein